MEKKRILHISKYYYPFRGGTEQTARDCVNALAQDFEQKVICFNSEKNVRNDIVDNVDIIRCGCFTKISSQSLSLSYAKRLSNVFKTFMPDVVIFHYPNPFVAALLLRYIPESCRLIVYWHLDIVKQKILGKIFFGQNKRILSRANIIISTSPNYIKGSPWLSSVEAKCKVIPSCINESRLQIYDSVIKESMAIKQLYSGKILCLAIGRHTEYKGFNYLIQASKLLDDRFEIFITGDGELTAELKKEATGDKKIHFLGVISDEQLKAYLLSMDIYCFSSVTKNEAFGLALAEGMYFGKPAVTFTIPGSGVNYVSLNNVTGIEVENRNVIEYAKAIEILGSNESLRKKYGEAAKERVKTHFLYSQYKLSIQKIVKEITDI